MQVQKAPGSKSYQAQIYRPHKGRTIRKVKGRGGGGGVVQKQKKIHASHKLKKQKIPTLQRNQKKYPARTTDETVYTYYTVCEKHACSRKFPLLLPPTSLPVIPIKSPPKVPSGISFYFFLVTTKL